MAHMEQTMKKISLPLLRVDIKSAFKDLYDKEQQKSWFESNSGSFHPYWNNLSYYIFDTIYNSALLDEYKESNIGKVFYDEEEAKVVWKFCSWFYELTEGIGGDKPNEAYLNHPEWNKVYSGAKEVFELMDANDKKYNFSDCLDEFNNTPPEEWFKQFKDK